MGKSVKGRKVVYGQNFLVNKDIARDIVELCNFTPDDNVVEIGSGKGALTGFIIGKTKTYTILEIDDFYFNLIKGKFNPNKFSGINILNEDALKFNYTGLSQTLSSKIRVISNLPYEISSPIIEKFTKEKHVFSDLTLMFQKEFAKRLYAKENDSERGALSVISDINFKIVKLFDVDKSNFSPAPRVDSIVVRITPIYHTDDDYIWAADSQFFSYFVHQIFKLRRKKLRNSIYASFFSVPPDVKESIFADVNVDLDKRPQELTTIEFIKVARKYDDYLKIVESGV